MPLVCYCKKCRAESPQGEICAHCGGKLTKASRRYSFQITYTPVKDWMRWNSAFRIILPVWLLLCAAVVLFEAHAVGWYRASAVMVNGTGTLLLILLGAAALCVFCWLLLCGREEHYYFLDHKGVHLSVYLMEPTKVKRLIRLIDLKRPEEEAYGLFAGEKEILWTQMKRVCLWPEKHRVLFYAPSWWMYLAMPCPENEYLQIAEFITEKIGKRKDCVLIDPARNEK